MGLLAIFIQNKETLLTEKKLSVIELINNGGLGGQIIIGLLFLLPVSYTHLTLPTIYSV